jgi:thiamine monophosphate synthase
VKNYHNYIFLSEINHLISKKILKIKKISIVYYVDNLKFFDDNNCKIISYFCKNNNIPFYILDSVKNIMKYRPNGIFLKADNRRILLNNRSKLKIIGVVHKISDFFYKKKQNCDLVMLSPLFYNKKYSNNSILGTTRFRLISMNSKINIGALGGISKKNLNQIQLIKTKNIGFRSMIYFA